MLSWASPCPRRVDGVLVSRLTKVLENEKWKKIRKSQTIAFLWFKTPLDGSMREIEMFRQQPTKGNPKSGDYTF
jgi:hypothetical protein